MRKIHYWIDTGFVTAGYEGTLEVYDDETDEDIDEYINDIMHNHITFGWYEEDKEHDD